MKQVYKVKKAVHLSATVALMVMSVFAFAEEPQVTLSKNPPISSDVKRVPLIEMVQKTISANPEVQARYHKLLESGFEQEVVRGGFLPRADIVSTYRKQENVIDIGGNTAIPRMNNELVLRQMIFDGFATRNEVERLGHANLVRYYELQSAMQSTTLEFMRAYVDTLRFRELTDYAKIITLRTNSFLTVSKSALMRALRVKLTLNKRQVV